MEEKIPLRLLKKEMISRMRIISREFLHLLLIWRFYRTHKPSEENKEKGKKKEISSLRKSFKDIDLQIKNVWTNLKKEELSDEEIKGIDFSAHGKSKDFDKITKISNETRKILEQIDFLQKKISYTLEAFPSYYPSPNIFRARQELKIYKILEEMAKEYIKWFLENIFEEKKIEEENIKTTVYWETDAENRFLPSIEVKHSENKKFLFLFKGSFYMVNQNSLWIILAHEAFHFLTRWFDENNKNNEFFKILSKHYQDFLETMEILKEGMNIESPDPKWIKTLFEDSICDSILTYALGEPYFIAIWRLVFGFDEDETHYRVASQWWIRLRTSLYVMEKYKLGNNIKDFEEFLENVHKILQQNSTYFEDRCIIEEKIAAVLKHYSFSIIKETKEENPESNELKLDRLKREIKYYHVDKILSDKLKEIKEDIIEEIEELNEGRIYAVAYENDFKPEISFPKSEKLPEGIKYNGESKENLKIEDVRKNTKVIMLRFLKIRFDGYKNREEFIKFIESLPEKSINENFLFYHLGAFYAVWINTDFGDKKFERKEWKSTIDELVNMKNSSEEKSNIDERDIMKKCLCYKEDIVANVICSLKRSDNKLELSIIQKENKLKNFFENSENSILIMIQCKMENSESQNKKIEIIEFAKKIMNEVNSCDKILISYPPNWADWLLLLKLNTEKNYNYTDIIEVKRITHEESNFQRTKTDILLGMKTDAEIPAPNILIRLSGEWKNNNYIKEIKKVELKGWKICLLPGVLDIALCPEKEEIKSSTLKKTIDKLINKKEKNTQPLISDIQMQFYFKHELKQT